MSGKASLDQQQAANCLPSVDDIFRFYIISRLGVHGASASQFLPHISHLQRGISLTLEEQRTSFGSLTALREQHHHSHFSQVFPLRKKFATTFRNEEINWSKIFYMLESIINRIKEDVRNVLLVDLFCHYCETVQVSSGGQTLSEWLVGTENKMKSMPEIGNVKRDQDMSSSGNSKESQETGPLTLVWAPSCSCDPSSDWDSLDCRKCNKCKKFPCLFDGCKIRCARPSLLEKHVKTVHSPEEQLFFENLLLRYKQHYCRCGNQLSHEGNLEYSRCSKCGRYRCLKGDCKTLSTVLDGIIQHQKKTCNFRCRSETPQCKNCGGEKVQNRKSIQRCPNSNCRVFWCPFCPFERPRWRLITFHIKRQHKAPSPV